MRILNQELPDLMTCDISVAGKDEVARMDLATEHIKRILTLSQSKRKPENYKIQLVNNIAYFTLVR